MPPRPSVARDDEHWAVRVHDDGRRHAAEKRRLDTRQAPGTDHDRLGVNPLSLVADRSPGLAFRDTTPNLKSVRASATPRSDVTRATWLAISSRPSPFEASLDMGAVRIVAGSYGAHSAAGSHTVSTTAVRGPSSAPAFAIAVAASFDPSKHRSTGCTSFTRFSSSVIASSFRIASAHTEPVRAGGTPASRPAAASTRRGMAPGQR